MRPSRLFLVVWTGQVLSRIGSGVSAFALGVHLFRETGSAAAYSLLLLSAFLPSILLAPVGGVIADRRNRRLLMATGDLGSALGILCVVGVLLLWPGRRWPIYLGVALSSVFVALQSPAFKATVTDLLDEREYSRAGGLIQLAEASRYLLAPILAVHLLARLSLPLVLVVDAASFVAAALAALAIGKVEVRKRATAAGGGFRRDLVDGLGYLAGNGFVRRLLVVTAGVTFLTGVLQSLFVPIVLSIADAATLGRVQSLTASGMLVSSLAIGCLGGKRREDRILPLALGAAGFFCLGLGASVGIAPFTVAAFGLFATLPFVNTSLEVLFRRNIDNGLQGRLWSLISLISQAGMLVAFGVAGVLADRVFNPLLSVGGPLADSVGRVIGTDAARGSGLMVMMSGCLLVLLSLLAVPGGAHRGVTSFRWTTRSVRGFRS